MDTAASHLSSVIYMFQLLFPDDYEDHSTQYDLLTSDPNGLSGLHAACTPFENFLLRILELWGNEAGFQRSSHYCFLEEAKWKSTVSNKQPVALTMLSASQGYAFEKAKEFQKNNYFCFIDYAKAFDCVDHNKLENSLRGGNTRPPDLPLEKPVCRSGSNS